MNTGSVIIMPKTQAEIDQLSAKDVGDVPVGLMRKNDGSLWWNDDTPAQVTITGDDSGPCYKFSGSTKQFTSCGCSGRNIVNQFVCQTNTLKSV